MGTVQALLVTVPEGMGWVGNWAPGIGDPTWTGWVTTIGYFLASYLCFGAYRRVARSQPQPGQQEAVRRLALIWWILTAALCFLGINKQLDLQTMFTEIGRSVAYSQGWYQRRRTVQMAFVVMMAVLGLLGIAGMFRLARGHLRQLRLALVGTVFLIAFVAIRATSFHMIDMVLSTQLKLMRVNALVEMSGIALVAIGAARSRRRPAPLRALRQR